MTWPAANTAVDEGLEVAGIRRSFGPNRVLDGVDLSVAAGTVSAVLGPSGCGKTTLLRIVAGFLAPEDGTVRLCGRTLVDSARSMPPERRRVGIVPQEGALFPHLDVAGNVGFGLARTPDRAERVARWLELVGLHGAEGARPHELSGGQQQRVALARALAAEPDLVLLDEPFSSLDAALRVQVREDVSRVLRDARCTAVIVTHDQQEALSLADQVAVLLQGRIAQAGTPDDLYRAPTSLAVATFVGEAVLLHGEMRDGVAQSALGRHGVVRAVPDGPATLVARPEQVVIDESGAAAHVIERRYYGADAIVRCRLDNGEIVVARTTGATAMEVDARTGLRVVGEVLAFQ